MALKRAGHPILKTCLKALACNEALGKSIRTGPAMSVRKVDDETND